MFFKDVAFLISLR
jgi:hypothetical protein